MLATRLEDPRRLADARYIAEPKLDGQRAQLHVRGHRIVLRYTHPRTGADVEIRQAVRVPRNLPFDLKIGERVGLVCWGVMPSGMLGNPVLRAER